MNVDALKRVGRPDQQASEELVRHIVDTATRLFISQGYAATSIEQIAAAAGSGKQTIYRRFTSKEALFIEVINRQGQRMTEMAAAAHASGGSPLAVLRGIGRSMFDFMLEPEMIALHRILIAETARFPELGELVLENCMGPFKELISTALQEAKDAGDIRYDNAEHTQLQMMGVLASGPMQKTLVGQDPFSSAADRESYFETAWNIFLHGVA